MADGMKLFRVEITGSKDMDYYVQAEDSYDAESIGEALFEQEFGEVMWSEINAWDAEEVNESESDSITPANVDCD